MIAWIGTGLLGSGFVRALRRRGEEVNVWNRTAGKARPLEKDGAKLHEDPAAAVRGAERVHLALSDDAAVDELLERLRPGLAAGTILVDHTTTSMHGAAARVKRWTERGFPFQHAPVFMGPQQALDGTGLMLASGDRAIFDRLSPELAKMTGKLSYLGPDPSRAAAFKLMGNCFLMLMTSGMTELLGLAKAMGVPAEEAATIFDLFNPATTLGQRAKRIVAADFAHPSWELAMARKDARLMMDEAARAGRELAVLPGLAAEMDRWIAKGHASDDWTVIAKDAL